MAKKSVQNANSKDEESTLDVRPQDGAINPSAPTAGTEAWGTTSDERRTLSSDDPVHTRAGQLKGNPGDSQTDAAQRASNAAGSNQQPHHDSAGNQADASRRSGVSPDTTNINPGDRT